MSDVPASSFLNSSRAAALEARVAMLESIPWFVTRGYASWSSFADLQQLGGK
jgi:hypothetical protein